MAKAKNRKKWIIYIMAAVVLAAATFLALPSKNNPDQTKANNLAGHSPSLIKSTSFDKGQYSLDEASSLWAIINKGRALPSGYVPAGLTAPDVPLRLPASDPEMMVRPDMARALEAMFLAARVDGLSLQLASGYRSYSEQSSVYAGYVKTSGQAAADTYSARPGHSEHQTGLAADIEPTSRHCEVDQCFADTPEGKWLAANSYKYGLIIRYQKNTQNLTGYEYEPWHVRYVGKPLAAQIQSSGQTLEQFFGLSIYADYPAQGLTLKT